MLPVPAPEKQGPKPDYLLAPSAEAIWWAFLRITDTGYLGDDVGHVRRSVSGVLTVLGAVIFLGAYLVEKTPRFSIARVAAHLLALLPLAVPGLALGLGYIFFFNDRANPLNFLYARWASSSSARSRISTRWRI